MDNFIVRLIGLAMIAGAAVYFIPLESISLFDYCWTLLLVLVGVIIISIPKDKLNDVKEVDDERN